MPNLLASCSWTVAGIQTSLQGLFSGLIAVAVRAQIKAHEWTQKTSAAGRTKAKEGPGIARPSTRGGDLVTTCRGPPRGRSPGMAD